MNKNIEIDYKSFKEKLESVRKSKSYKQTIINYDNQFKTTLLMDLGLISEANKLLPKTEVELGDITLKLFQVMNVLVHDKHVMLNYTPLRSRTETDLFAGYSSYMDDTFYAIAVLSHPKQMLRDQKYQGIFKNIEYSIELEGLYAYKKGKGQDLLSRIFRASQNFNMSLHAWVYDEIVDYYLKNGFVDTGYKGEHGEHLLVDNYCNYSLN